MKYLILGSGQHGKDTLAELMAQMFDLSFVSSSMAALDAAVWPALQAAGLHYPNKLAAYNDRMNHRQLWKKAISDYNYPDKASLARTILETNDVYVGMRCDLEFAASREMFDKIFWVHRPGWPSEPSLAIEYDPTCMIPIVNLGDKASLAWQVFKEVNSPEK